MSHSYCQEAETDMDTNTTEAVFDWCGDAKTELQSCWEIVKQKLDEELTREDMRQVLQLIKDHLGDNMGHLWNSESPREFLEVLENNTTDTEAIEIVKTVMDILSYHIDTGATKFSDYIQAVQNRFSDVKRKYNIPSTDVFVGRADDIARIYRLLTDSEYKGVWFSGLGGMGKTTLALEICQRMASSWTILNVDLKEQRSVIDCARALLLALGTPTCSNDQSELITMATTEVQNLNNDTILLLDNTDSVLEQEEENMCALIQSLVQFSKPRVKMMVTARQGMPQETDRDGNSLSSQIFHHGIRQLDHKDAIVLLKRLTKPRRLPEETYEALASGCGGCPLDIRLVAGSVRQPQFDVRTLLSPDGSVPQNMKRGLQCWIMKSFDTFDTHYQESLNTLSMFKTAPFDLKDVEVLLGVGSDQARILMMFFRHKHFVEYTQVTSGNTEISTNFSFHPRVAQFLQDKGEQSPQSYCRFIQLFYGKIDKIAAEFHTNYFNANKAILGMQTFCATAFSVLTHHLPPSDRPSPMMSRTLREISNLIHKPLERSQIWRNLARRFSSAGDPGALMFSKIQEARGYIDENDHALASGALSEIEEMIMNMESETIEQIRLQAEYYVVKGRLRRCQKKYVDAKECLSKAKEQYDKLGYNEEFIVDISSLENLKGGVCYDAGDIDEALELHRSAYRILNSYVGTENHPHLSIYVMNIGTVALAKGVQLSDTDEIRAREYFEEALSTFNKGMKIDVTLKAEKRSAYIIKLRMRASVKERLAKFNESYFHSAIDDAEQALTISRLVFEDPHIQTMLCHGQIARIHLKQAVAEKERGKRGEANKLLKETIILYRKIEDYVKDFHLEVNDKMQDIFNDYHRALGATGNEKEQDKLEIFKANYFAGKYTRGSDSETSSSSSTSSPSKSSTSTIHSLDRDSDSSEQAEDMDADEVMFSLSDDNRAKKRKLSDSD